MTANESLFGPQSLSSAIITGGATRATGAFSIQTECTAISSNNKLSADFVLSISYTTAPTAGGVVLLYMRPINIDGANNAPEPDASYKHEPVGAFIVDGVTTQQYLYCRNVPLINGDMEFYIQNNADQTADADYVLKYKPISVYPATA